MRGYKAFNKDMTCRHFQYEVGGKYESDEELQICKRGFHFCENLIEFCVGRLNKLSTDLLRVKICGTVQETGLYAFYKNK